MGGGVKRWHTEGADSDPFVVLATLESRLWNTFLYGPDGSWRLESSYFTLLGLGVMLRVLSMLVRDRLSFDLSKITRVQCSLASVGIGRSDMG